MNPKFKPRFAPRPERKVTIPVSYHEEEFSLYPQKEVVTLMSDPVKNAPDFDTKNGDGAAATVIARVEKGQMDPKRYKKEFRHVDVQVLFMFPSDEKHRANFDEKYGVGAAAKILRATKVVPNYRGLVMEARKAKIIEFGQARKDAMKKARRGDNEQLLEIKKQTQQLRDKLVAMQKEDMQKEEAEAKKEDEEEEEPPPVPEPATEGEEELTDGAKNIAAETQAEVPEEDANEDAEEPTTTTAR